MSLTSKIYCTILQEEQEDQHSSVNEDSYGNETFSSSSSNNGDRVHSDTPSEYDERNRIFHLNFIRRFVKEVTPMPKKCVAYIEFKHINHLSQFSQKF